MAKTHLYFSRPQFKRKAPGVYPAGAGYPGFWGRGILVPLCGKMQTMPACPNLSGREKIDLDKKGNVVMHSDELSAKKTKEYLDDLAARKPAPREGVGFAPAGALKRLVKYEL